MSSQIIGHRKTIQRYKETVMMQLNQAKVDNAISLIPTLKSKKQLAKLSVVEFRDYVEEVASLEHDLFDAVYICGAYEYDKQASIYSNYTSELSVWGVNFFGELA